MARSGKDGWTEWDLATLRREWKAGTSANVLAEKFGRSVKAVKNAADRRGLKRDAESHAAKTVDAATPQVLQMWVDGVPVEIIAVTFGISANAVRIRAANHRVRRPDWYVSMVRSKA